MSRAHECRSATQEFYQFRPQDGVGGMVGGGEPDRAGRLLAQLAQRRKLGLDLLEARA
jgi:hypothetical protein